MGDSESTGGGRGPGEVALRDLLDVQMLRPLLEQFTQLTGVPIGLVDYPRLEVLVSSDWRDLCAWLRTVNGDAGTTCAEFHRRLLDPRTAPQGAEGPPCTHGLTECAAPVLVEGVPVAGLLAGPVRLDPPDAERLRATAQGFGLPQAEYVQFLQRVPVVDRARVLAMSTFQGRLAAFISQLAETHLVARRRLERAGSPDSARGGTPADDESYRTVVESAAEGIVMAECESRVLRHANPAACAMFGYAPGEMLGLRVDELHPAEVRDWVRADFAAIARGEKQVSPAVPCLRRDGSRFHADIVARSVVLGGRAMNVGFFTDVTERHQAVEALREREERHRSILASMNDLVFVLDEEGRFQDYHAPDAGKLSVPPERFLGRTYREVLPSPVAEALGRAIHAARSLGPVQGFEYEMEIAGRRTWWSATVCPRRNARGGFAGVTVVTRDQTQRRVMEERLWQAEKLTALGQFAGGVGHDFNNQLGIILGYASLLANDLDREEWRDCARAIVQATQHAAGLTQKLLAFARKGKYRSIPVDVHALLRDLAHELQRSSGTGIRVRLALGASTAWVKGDPAQLQCALLSLADNARDSLPEGGEIAFETENLTLGEAEVRGGSDEIAPGPYLCVRVVDRGHGMTAEVQRHLFEPFFTTKPPGAGTGMGLAGVYGTVGSHGGTITIDSEVGRGTTVRLYLPSQPPSVQEQPPAVPVAVPGRAHVLLVDDESMLREVTSQMLRSLGHEVTSCANGREAVEYHARHWRDIDLVILDMIMPEMGGREAFRALRRTDPRVRVLLSSGFSADGEVQSILDEGMAGFLGKPYSQAELARQVALALASGRGSKPGTK